MGKAAFDLWRALQAVNIKAQLFLPQPESLDDTPLYGLRQQQITANDWLDRQPQTRKLLLNLHSDTGNSHTFGIYGTTDPLAIDAARILAADVSKALPTAAAGYFDRLGSIDYKTYLFATMARHSAILIELFSHCSERDMQAFKARRQELIGAIVTGLCILTDEK